MSKAFRICDLVSATEQKPVGFPQADPQEFRRGMRRLASGVSIVTTVHRGQRFGLALTSVASVSAEPPVLLVCVSRTASSHDPIAYSGSFCVNVLGTQHGELARRFGDPLQRSRRFQDGEWKTLATGAPVFAGSLVSLDCVVTRVLGADSHTVFFGRVADVKLGTGGIDPLLYWDGAYRSASAD